MDNYEFCTQWILDQTSKNESHVLDFGCGAGEIVNVLRSLDVLAFGCDVFYEGGSYSQSINMGLFDKGIIRRMQGNTIPFESGTFDIIVNNQVMEHVEDLDLVVSEIRRVLKPTGIVLNLFPDASVWREGHTGIPFLHWFPRKSSTRIIYAAGLRLIGFGYNKETKDVFEWSKNICEWLDKWTHYRTKEEITCTYKRYFKEVRHIESYWLRTRFRKDIPLVNYLPEMIQKMIVQKMGGLVFIAQYPI